MIRNHFSFIVKFEGDGHVERVVSRSFSEGKQSAAQFIQFVDLIIIRCPEIGGTDCAEIRVVFFRYFGTEEKPAVLRHADQWLTDGYVVPSLTRILFTYPAIGAVMFCPMAEWFFASAS